MDSLSSAPGNKNNSNRLLSAAFAIAASISGSVNAATAPTPKFTDEPAGSPKILDVAKAQQAILDMLPADHKSRPGIAAAIKTLEDGGSVQELTALFIWAKTIVDSPMAPPAAKEKAKEILSLIAPVEPTKAEQKERMTISRKKGDLFEDFKPGKKRGEIIQDWAVNSEGVQQLKYEVDKEGILHISGNCPGQEGKVFLVPKGKFADARTKKGPLTVGFLGWNEPSNMAFAQVRIKNGNQEQRLNISRETGLAYADLSRGEDNKSTLICLVFKNGDFSAKLSSPTMHVDDSSVVADIKKQ